MGRDKWDEWYKQLDAAKPESKQWYEIAAMMENHHVRASIFNRDSYDEKELLEVAERALGSAERCLGKNHARSAKARELAGDRNPVLAKTYYALGIYWYKKEQAAKAEEVLREALEIQRADPNVDSEDLGQTLLILSYATAVTKGNEVALALAQEAQRIVSTKAPKSKLRSDVEKRIEELRDEED